MSRTELTVAEALAQAQMIEASMAAWEETAPGVVASLGGRDALARHCEMTCIGPVPRLDVGTWQSASIEWWDRRQAEAGSPYAAPPREVAPCPTADVPVAAEPAAAPPKRSRWRIFSR
jgi:hypothetical protein